MMQVKLLLISSIIVLSSVFLKAQQDSTVNSIYVTGTAMTPFGVVLRWAPASPGFWRICNYYGYRIERAPFDSTRVKMDWTVLEEVFQPRSLEEWRTQVNITPQDTFLMVAGQAIHGQTREAGVSLQSMMDKSDELTNLYSACLLAAERSRLAGNYAALRYEDSTAEPGTSYVYRITTLAPDPQSYVIVVDGAEVDFPKVVPDEVREGEHSIEIFWRKDAFSPYYSSFYFYRSNDGGKTFNRINSIPVATTAYQDDQRFIFRDSLVENYREYQYKIEGLTSYATRGPLSDPITAMGRDRTPPPAPFNISLKYLGNAMMEIRWETDPQATDIAGFRISKSNEQQKEFVEITSSPLSAKTRVFIDSTCNEYINNYYWIGVFDKENNVNVSVPSYGTIRDTTPPKPPVDITGRIDTNGVVTIQWKKGSEPDLKGYFVHYANDRRHTFINRTGYPVQDTIWRDTIPLNVLTEEIYYKIVAIDHRFNYSGYSTMLTLRKPDLVPPAAPVFTRSYSDKSGVYLQWNNSQSHDVQYNVLQRRARQESVFTDLYRCRSTAEGEAFTDSLLVPGQQYIYRLYAIDDAGLISPPVSELHITAYVDKVLDPVEQFTVKQEDTKRTPVLTWQYVGGEEFRYIIYRSVNGAPLQTYRVVDGSPRFTDVSYKKGDVIIYRVKVANRQGWQSNFSKEAQLTIQ